MDAFAPTPPAWTQDAIHTHRFSCPKCGASSQEATAVWLNRRAPVYTYDRQRKWQEFYRCDCSAAWWAWSSDRPPTASPEDAPPDR